jgi:hypothetical protein
MPLCLDEIRPTPGEEGVASPHVVGFELSRGIHQ